MMQKFRRIQQLNHVFFGTDTARSLQMNSQDCYEQLLGRHNFDTKLAEHEFALRDPRVGFGGTYDEYQKSQQWVQRRNAYVKANAAPFAWRWADRELDMGTCGDVQAVVACLNNDA